MTLQSPIPGPSQSHIAKPPYILTQSKMQYGHMRLVPVMYGKCNAHKTQTNSLASIFTVTPTWSNWDTCTSHRYSGVVQANPPRYASALQGIGHALHMMVWAQIVSSNSSVDYTHRIAQVRVYYLCYGHPYSHQDLNCLSQT